MSGRLNQLFHASLTLSVFVLVVCLSACTKVNSGVVGMFNFDTDLKVVLEVSDDINPDEKHTASPLYLRFYELTSDKVFNKTDFLELYENDETILGKDLIAKQELDAVLPGVSREERFVVDPATRFVAIFAEFYEFRNSKYKLVFPVTSNNVIENTVRIEISDNKLILRSAH